MTVFSLLSSVAVPALAESHPTSDQTSDQTFQSQEGPASNAVEVLDQVLSRLQEIKAKGGSIDEAIAAVRAARDKIAGRSARVDERRSEREQRLEKLESLRIERLRGHLERLITILGNRAAALQAKASEQALSDDAAAALDKAFSALDEARDLVSQLNDASSVSDAREVASQVRKTLRDANQALKDAAKAIGKEVRDAKRGGRDLRLEEKRQTGEPGDGQQTARPGEPD